MENKATVCSKLKNWSPVIFVIITTLICYYAYVVEFCLKFPYTKTERIIYVSSFNFFIFMSMWGYFRAVYTDLGTVPEQFRIPPGAKSQLLSNPKDTRILEALSENLPIVTRDGLNGEIRYCTVCWVIKPDRTHHCSVCKKCIMGMDHHCPFINNCVGFRNHKFTMLFLIYMALASLQVIVTILPTFVACIIQRKPHFVVIGLFLVVVFLGLGFDTSLASALCYFVLVNTTTVESKRTPVFKVNGEILGETRLDVSKPRGKFFKVKNRENDGRGEEKRTCFKCSCKKCEFMKRPDNVDGVHRKNLFNLGIWQNVVQVYGRDIGFWFLPTFTSLGNGWSYPIKNVEADRRGVSGKHSCYI